MLTEDAKEYIRSCLGNLISKTKLENGIIELDKYLNYIKCQHNNAFGSIINDYTVASFLQQKNQVKSFLDIEFFLGQLAEVLNLNDASRLAPLPSDQKRGITTITNWTMERYLKQAFNLFPDTFNLTKESHPLNIDNYKEVSIERHLLNLYHYRNNTGDHFNSDSSVSTLTLDDINRLTKSMFFVMVYLVEKYSGELEEIYHKSNQKQLSNSYDIRAYTNGILSEYSKCCNFEYLDTRWDFDIDHTNGMTIKEIINADYSNKIIAFIGEAGTGKTTALKRLELEYAKKCNKNSFKKLPIYIELKKLRQSDSAIEKAVLSRLEIPEGRGKAIIKNEAIVLLLDGFNEISDKQFAASIRSEAEAILEANDKILIFITDRNNKYTQFKAIHNLMYCYLHELSMDEKRDFFKANSKMSTTSDIINQQIRDELEAGTKPIIQSLKTPYMLSVFLSYVDENGSIPKDPIQDYIEKLFEREEKEQKDSDDPKYFEQMKMVLGALAYKYSNNEFRRSEAQRTIGIIKSRYAFQALDSSECIELSIKMGILERSDENILQFRSKEFCDYFEVYAMAEGIDEQLDE